VIRLDWGLDPDLPRMMAREVRTAELAVTSRIAFPSRVPRPAENT